MDGARSERPGRAAVQIFGQRYLNPSEFIPSLADAVRARGGRILDNSEVTGLQPATTDVRVTGPFGQQRRHDAVVIATGAAFGELAHASAYVARCRPGAATASACLSNGCPPARCTSRRSGSPVLRWAAGCG
nr:FAD-dependent oxidoreductase [Micromonospora provocatoris]